VAIAVTLGTHEPLRRQLRIALHNGVTPEEIVETFIHVEAYAGAARAFDCHQTALEAFAEAAKASEESSRLPQEGFVDHPPVEGEDFAAGSRRGEHAFGPLQLLAGGGMGGTDDRYMAGMDAGLGAEAACGRVDRFLVEPVEVGDVQVDRVDGELARRAGREQNAAAGVARDVPVTPVREPA
jgi:hypothetical protein